MKFNRRGDWGGPAKHRLPLIALIDVVLFLLLYFMVAGSLAAEEAELAAALKADKAGGGRAADLAPQVVTVESGQDGHPQFRLGQRVVPDRDALFGVIKGLPKEGGIFVKVTGAVPVEAGAAALQACKDAGFVRITYVPAN